MTDKKIERDAAVGALILIALIAVQFLDAYVILSLWRWFVVPLGLPVVGMGQAYGLAVLIAFVAKSPHVAVKSDDPWEIFKRNVVWALGTMSIGAGVHFLGGV